MSPRPTGQTWPGQAVTKRPRPTVVHPELRPLAQALRVRAGTRCSPPVTAPACHGLAATVWPLATVRPPPFGRRRLARLRLGRLRLAGGAPARLRLARRGLAPQVPNGPAGPDWPLKPPDRMQNV